MTMIQKLTLVDRGSSCAKQNIRMASGHQVDEKDIEHYSKIGDQWWNYKGPCKNLHYFNDVRVPFVIQGLQKTGRIKSKSLRGVKILDVGCAAGIVAERLAKEGAEVVAIDPAKELIEVAKRHLVGTQSRHADINVTYICELIQDHAAKHEGEYDAVMASEVIEHVPDPDFFIEHCVKALKPGGSIFVTTLNRTLSSLYFGWLWAEWILAIIPRGSHSWWKFQKPDEVEKMFENNNCHRASSTGFLYEFYFGRYVFCKNQSVQYGIQGVKNVFENK